MRQLNNGFTEYRAALYVIGLPQGQMLLSDFDYDLPEELIAQHPAEPRDASRMLFLNRQKNRWSDHSFIEFPAFLREGDVIVVNNTKVFPARLIGKRVPSGGKAELFLVRELEQGTWEALSKPAHRLPEGAQLVFGDGDLNAQIVGRLTGGLCQVRFESKAPFEAVLEKVGQTPLPPYIKRSYGNLHTDRERYQTVYAQRRGAIAAPTAGLHFTQPILDEIVAQGISIAEITLHVGYGTFEPVRGEDPLQHHVAAEWYEVEDEASRLINQARSRPNTRIIAVGTTTTRALESAATDDGFVNPQKGWAHLTIRPGYRFGVVQGLLTNFHLPRSSLLFLVSAFASRESLLSAYRHAVKSRYRFYSYGDCMLII